MGAATGLFSTIQQLTLSLGVVVGVGSLTGMRWLYATGQHDMRIYSGSIMALSAMAVAGLLAAYRLDPDSTGALRPTRKT